MRSGANGSPSTLRSIEMSRSSSSRSSRIRGVAKGGGPCVQRSVEAHQRVKVCARAAMPDLRDLATREVHYGAFHAGPKHGAGLPAVTSKQPCCGLIHDRDITSRCRFGPPTDSSPRQAISPRPRSDPVYPAYRHQLTLQDKSSGGSLSPIDAP